ncbi:MAG: glycosyltransferase [Anaerolineales bacterium]|jgi:glycosyltransferase involved in cell wall biosynthesis
MRIAYISQAYPPIVSGASFAVQRLAEGMVQRGHTVLVLVPSDRGKPYTEQDKHMRIVRLKSLRNPMRSYQKFIPFSYKLIHTELEAFKPDLIHSHDVLTLCIFSLAAGRQMHIPVVTTIHQLPWFISAHLPDFPGLKLTIEEYLWKYSRWLNKNCQVMIVPTEMVSRTVKTHAGFLPIVISNGIDINTFSASIGKSTNDARLFKKYDLDPDLPIILHVGRLDIDKNVDVVIRVAARVMAQTHAQLLVVGDGECRKSLMALSRKLGIDHRSSFPGFVDLNSDLPDLYRLSTVFTTASEIETQGLVLLEAMASGLPIVAVDATCIHEVVKNKINGYLIPPGDESGLVDALIHILRHPKTALQMGQAGHMIVQEHSTDHSLEKHENLYKDTIFQYQKKVSVKRSQNDLSQDRLKINSHPRILFFRHPKSNHSSDQ